MKDKYITIKLWHIFIIMILIGLGILLMWRYGNIDKDLILKSSIHRENLSKLYESKNYINYKSLCEDAGFTFETKEKYGSLVLNCYDIRNNVKIVQNLNKFSFVEKGESK